MKRRRNGTKKGKNARRKVKYKKEMFVVKFKGTLML
jgi:hypothetical protein